MLKNRKCSRREILVVAVMLMLTASATAVTAQQKPRAKSIERNVELGRGMSLLTMDLMQIATQSELFLRFAGKIDLTKEQQKKLEELYFEYQQYSVRREADLNVADAELKRLLVTDRVDLSAVKVKVKEVEAIQSEAAMKKIETVLQAIGTLTHDQHLRVMLLVRETLPSEPPVRTVA